MTISTTLPCTGNTNASVTDVATQDTLLNNAHFQKNNCKTPPNEPNRGRRHMTLMKNPEKPRTMSPTDPRLAPSRPIQTPHPQNKSRNPSRYNQNHQSPLKNTTTMAYPIPPNLAKPSAKSSNAKRSIDSDDESDTDNEKEVAGTVGFELTPEMLARMAIVKESLTRLYGPAKEPENNNSNNSKQKQDGVKTGKAINRL